MKRKAPKREAIQRALIWADGAPMTARQLAAEARCSLSYAYRVLAVLTTKQDATYGVTFAKTSGRKVAGAGLKGRAARTFTVGCPEAVESFEADCAAQGDEITQRATTDDRIDHEFEAWAATQGDTFNFGANAA